MYFIVKKRKVFFIWIPYRIVEIKNSPASSQLLNILIGEINKFVSLSLFTYQSLPSFFKTFYNMRKRADCFLCYFKLPRHIQRT
jgi:hypothetical protein